MAADFAKVVEYVERAAAELEKAVAEFAATDRVTLQTSYVMGHIRAGLAVCASVREFATQTEASRDTKPKSTVSKS